jgi:hypothetical protein
MQAADCCCVSLAAMAFCTFCLLTLVVMGVRMEMIRTKTRTIAHTCSRATLHGEDDAHVDVTEGWGGGLHDREPDRARLGRDVMSVETDLKGPSETRSGW